MRVWFCAQAGITEPPLFANRALSAIRSDIASNPAHAGRRKKVSLLPRLLPVATPAQHNSPAAQRRRRRRLRRIRRFRRSAERDTTTSCATTLPHPHGSHVLSRARGVHWCGEESSIIINHQPRDHRETRGKSERQGLGLTGRKSKSLTSSVRRRADLPLQRPWSCPPSDISPLYNAPYRTGTVPSSPRISLHF